MSKTISQIWLEEFTSKDEVYGFPHCGLCGNCGILTKEGMKTPAGHKLTPLRAYCICPNGRIMKRRKAKI